MGNFEVGVKVDNSDAVVALGDVDESIEQIGETSENTNKKITKSFKKMSIGVNAFQKATSKTGKVGKAVFSKIEKGAGKVKKKLGEWRVEAIALGNSMKGPLKAGIGTATVAVTALVGALVLAGTQGVETANILQKLSDTTAISAKNVTAYYTAIKRGGGDVDDAKDSLNDFVERIGDARSGSGAFQEAFTALGVDINGPIDKALRDSIKTLSTMENQSDAVFRGIEVFGNEYKLIADQIRNGNDILEGSPLFSPEYLKASRELTGNMNKMKVSFMTTLNKGLEPFVIKINEMFKTLTKDDMERFANSTIDAFKAVIKAGALAFTALDTVFSGWDMLIQSSITSLTRYVSTWNGTASKMLGMAVSWTKAMNKLKPGEFFDIDTAGAEALSASLLATSEDYAKAADISASRTTEIINGTNARTEALAKLIVELDNLTIASTKANSGDDGGGGSTPPKAKKERTGKSYTQVLIEEDIALREAWEIDKEAKRQIAKDNELAFQETMAQSIQSIGENAIASAFDVANSISQIRSNAREKEISDLQASQAQQLRGMKISGAAKYAIERKNAKKVEALRKEGAEKQRKLQIASTLSNMAGSIAQVWAGNLAQFTGPATPVGVALSAATTGLLVGTTVGQIAAMKSEKYAEGGIVPGNNTTGDKVPAQVNSKEMIITQQQQATLFKIANGGGGGAGQGITLNIENLTADDDGLDKLEDRLYALQSAGRFQFA